MASEALHIPKGVHARVSIDDLEGQGKLKGMGTKNAEQAAAWLAPEFAGPDGQPAVSKIKFELDEEGSATSVQMLVLLVGLAVFSLREGLVAKFGHSGRVRSGVLKAVSAGGRGGCAAHGRGACAAGVRGRPAEAPQGRRPTAVPQRTVRTARRRS